MSKEQKDKPEDTTTVASTDRDTKSDQDAITNNLPSDALFEKIMAQEVAAQEFLDAYLPDKLKALVDISKVTIGQESFVEDDLTSKFSDIIYSLPTKGGNQAYI